MKRFLISSIIVVLGVVGLAVVLFLSAAYNPDDRFQVVGVESDANGQHAVTYRYRHSNSSNEFFVTWILPAPPPIGSTEPVRGRQPVLVSFASKDMTPLEWMNGRLTAAPPGTADVRREVSACLYEYDQPHLVCVDPKFVDVR